MSVCFPAYTRYSYTVYNLIHPPSGIHVAAPGAVGEVSLFAHWRSLHLFEGPCLRLECTCGPVALPTTCAVWTLLCLFCRDSDTAACWLPHALVRLQLKGRCPLRLYCVSIQNSRVLGHLARDGVTAAASCCLSHLPTRHSWLSWFVESITVHNIVSMTVGGDASVTHGHACAISLLLWKTSRDTCVK